MGPLHRHARLHSLEGIRGRSCKAQNYPLDGKKLNQLRQQQGETRLLTHSLLQRTTNVRMAGQDRLQLLSAPTNLSMSNINAATG